MRRRGIHSFGSLDHAERRRFHYVMSEFMVHAQNAYQLQQKGVLDKDDADAWIGFALQILRMPGASDWWAASRRVVDPGFSAELDQRLQQPGESLTEMLPHFSLDGAA